MYLYAYFANKQNAGILTILRVVGCSDLVAQIEPVLREPIGKVSFIEALCLYRARTITHPKFDYDDLFAKFEAKRLDTDEAREQFASAFQRAQFYTDALPPELMRRYPTAF